MSADRFFLPQSGHLAMLLPPQDVTGGKHSAAFNFSLYSHVSLIVGIGVSAAAPGAVTVEACTAADGTGATAIPFNVFKQEATASDVLGPLTLCAAAGFIPPATDNIFYDIEVDATSIPTGFKYLRVSIADAANSCIAVVFAVLSGARYAGDQSPTVLV